MARFLFFSVIASAGCAVLMAFLWIISLGTYAERMIQLPLAELRVGYNDGNLLLGAFQEETQPKRKWWARRPLQLSDLDHGFDAVCSTSSWAISIPFLFLVFVFAIPPAWWLVIYRDRHEMNRRITEGLCLNCGYDTRHTSDRPCPECGTPPRSIAKSK